MFVLPDSTVQTLPVLTYDAVKRGGVGGSGYAVVRWHGATYARNYVITIVLSVQLPFMNLSTVRKHYLEIFTGCSSAVWRKPTHN